MPQGRGEVSGWKLEKALIDREKQITWIFFRPVIWDLGGELRRNNPVNAAGNENDGKIKSMRLTLCVYQNNKQKEEVIRRVWKNRGPIMSVLQSLHPDSSDGLCHPQKSWS
jgi:hypothetical protein